LFKFLKKVLERIPPLSIFGQYSEYLGAFYDSDGFTRDYDFLSSARERCVGNYSELMPLTIDYFEILSSDRCL
jgi:hypothetical protein